MSRSQEPSATPPPIVYYPDRLQHATGPRELTPSQAVRLSEDPELASMAQRTAQARLHLPGQAPHAPAPDSVPPRSAGAAAAGAGRTRLPFEPSQPRPSLARRLLRRLGLSGT